MTSAQIQLFQAILRNVKPVTDNLSATALDADRKKRAERLRRDSV